MNCLEPVSQSEHKLVIDAADTAAHLRTIQRMSHVELSRDCLGILARIPNSKELQQGTSNRHTEQVIAIAMKERAPFSHLPEELRISSTKVRHLRFQLSLQHNTIIVKSV